MLNEKIKDLIQTKWQETDLKVAGKNMGYPDVHKNMTFAQKHALMLSNSNLPSMEDLFQQSPQSQSIKKIPSPKRRNKPKKKRSKSKTNQNVGPSSKDLNQEERPESYQEYL